LTPGDYYSFKVRSVNYIGVSPYSKLIRIIAASLPQQPLNLQRVTTTIASVSFEWDMNLDDGGTKVRDYLVYWDTGDDQITEDSFVEADHTSYQTQEHTEFNLQIGTYHRFFVIARNDAGISERSGTIRLKACEVNSEPLDLHTTFQDETTISQAWEVPIDVVGSDVELYYLE
jgi:hypothetical protein